jgi:ectoine hydroxylase-related dioxygenase (phytanoyl-CoA dioxygenase family)
MSISLIRHSELAFQVEREGYAILPVCFDEPSLGQLCRAMAEEKYGQRNLLGEPIVKQLALSNAVQAVVGSVLGSHFFAVKGTFFNKTPNANWKVPWHQDLTIMVRDRVDVEGFGPWTVKDGVQNVQPPYEILTRILAVRVHLDENDADNGPLRVIPGSHHHGRLSAQQIADWDKRASVTCFVPQGGALLMRPLLLHASSASKLPKNRRVIHLEFTTEELPGGLQWHTKI